MFTSFEGLAFLGSYMATVVLWRSHKSIVSFFHFYYISNWSTPEFFLSLNTLFLCSFLMLVLLILQVPFPFFDRFGAFQSIPFSTLYLWYTTGLALFCHCCWYIVSVSMRLVVSTPPVACIKCAYAPLLWRSWRVAHPSTSTLQTSSRPNLVCLQPFDVYSPPVHFQNVPDRFSFLVFREFHMFDAFVYPRNGKKTAAGTPVAVLWW